MTGFELSRKYENMSIAFLLIGRGREIFLLIYANQMPAFIQVERFWGFFGIRRRPPRPRRLDHEEKEEGEARWVVASNALFQWSAGVSDLC